jgi:hypothetical protein
VGEKCKANIISMSFGWTKEVVVAGKGDRVISQAIQRAVTNAGERILFFAAASNYGANAKELFPANHGWVTTIRATNHLGGFPDLNAPPQDSKRNFGTLGINVPCARLGLTQKEISMTGTSAATPIAAGIAALVLGYANLRLASKGICEPDCHKWKELWSKKGMEAMFWQLSRPTQTLDCYYLSINSFVNTVEGDIKRDRMMDNAVEEL